ncbi:MAG: DEAD/DEAH box helicase, partial [Cyanobacteria bacterium P01_D01_bin.123]
SFKQVFLKDRYIPAFKYRALPKPKSKAARKTTPGFELYPGWEIVSEQYEANLHYYAEHMPTVCACASNKSADTPLLWDKVSLLRHFSEVLLDDILLHTPRTQQFDKLVDNSLLKLCFQHNRQRPFTDRHSFKLYEKWLTWRQELASTQSPTAFYLGFVLEDPEDSESDWDMYFVAIDRQEPSFRLTIADYWLMTPEERERSRSRLGPDFEQRLLVQLGYAARMYPLLWKALDRAAPFGFSLSLEEAFEFLTEYAWILEDAGFKAIVPSWWTPTGRRRAKIKLKAKSGKTSSKNAGKSYFGADRLVDYEYQLAIGDEPVSDEEWQELQKAATPLVMFRGQWVELDPDKMKEMLEFWKTQPHDKMSLEDLIKLDSQQDSDVEVDLSRDRALTDLMAQLRDPSKLEVLPSPAQLQGQLREYQQRGLSWLNYLETLGLNGCLADDMGLGKTIQVIARLVQERETLAELETASESKVKSKASTTESSQTLLPTLLIVPTSVVGNWRHEIEKFAPHLRVAIHHGSNRNRDEASFQRLYTDYSVIITSFTLARKDNKLLTAVEWHRIVLDEAQNIKNPKSAQTKAILKLQASHRLALTGTPVENRLMDLWSIFNFLNPGYLGKQAQFRKSFETPIQKHNDYRQSATLKKLVEPFILRRMKTDRNIIKDLPDKVEQKVFCNLTKEQASLYQGVVKQITEELETAEGISRRGLILSSLMKLKQICNHPRQFLQDGSDFIPERSHKLSRLTEMIAEAIEEGESMLVFTQFTEIGEALEHHLKHTYLLNTYYLHGGTSRKKRERTIAEFQDPETEPSVFILSLKAGGVGITLTKANHVFHFDRWWNPAVEDQATDRAFRIGQTKNVFVHKFVAIGTLEERIDEMIEDKKKLAGSVVGTDESWLTELDNEAFQQLISLNASAVL